MSENLACIILAAGLGKRMNSSEPKAAIRTREKALIVHVLDSLAALKPDKVVVVTGHKREVVEELVNTRANLFRKVPTFAVQKEQRGTGDAVKSALSAIKDFNGTVLILCADTPLLQEKTLLDLVKTHHESCAAITLISFDAQLPNSYGRVIRSRDTGQVLGITEAKDCSIDELQISEANSGVYAVASSFLAPAVLGLENNNAQKEYYLTDIVARAKKKGQKIAAYKLSDPDETVGVNTPSDLAKVNRILAKRQINKMIDEGVEFANPDSCQIDPEVKIGSGAKIGLNVQLRGNCLISSGTEIEGPALIIDTDIGENSVIKFSSRIESSKIGANTSVGPFANLRPGSDLGNMVRIGNFVEVKNSIFSDGAKASHLSYLGDCQIGENSNIGAGTITANYDGYSKKSRTEIGNEVRIGSNSTLIAPLKIGDGASVGAGSVITKDIESDVLAFTRAELKIKPGWAKKKRNKLS